jgi:peptide-methionine (S)-S-oxide reductase
LTRETATLAGGCFWCIEATLQRLRGVVSVTPGYTGGQVARPTYPQVCTGETGHAEAVQVVFDAELLPYGDLLRIFFAVHDPTTPDRQGPDVGPQYRSAIFYHSAEQRRVAEEVMAELRRDQVFPAPIVTELKPLDVFWPAEDDHRDYYRRHPDQAYCRVVIAPKLAKLRHAYADRLGDGA